MSIRSLLLSVGAVLILTAVVLAIPGCQYHALDGSTRFLKRGESYVDVGDKTDGTCVLQATCQKDNTISEVLCAAILINVNCSLVEDKSAFAVCCACPRDHY